MATTSRFNVLVYSGPGVSIASLSQALISLRSLLTPRYAVHTVTPTTLIEEPWPPSTALVVFPGGADLAYGAQLNGSGNQRIRGFVQGGGAYLGLCAGGYYGSGRCEFEIGREGMEVIGPRELAFFPGTCRGGAFRGFVYNSEKGARAAAIEIRDASKSKPESSNFCSYSNGGGVFVDADSAAMKDKGVEILGRYTQDLDVDTGKGAAAVVCCKVGDGRAVLTGPHPEFSPHRLDRNVRPGYEEVVDAIMATDRERVEFLKLMLRKLGLKVNSEEDKAPSLTPIHLSSSEPQGVTKLLQGLSEIIVEESGARYIRDDNDVFQFDQADPLALGDLQASLASIASTTEDSSEAEELSKIIKRIIVHDSPGSLPSKLETPQFDHAAYFQHLKNYQAKDRGKVNPAFGATLLYGEVVTSTSTLLEKNTRLLRRLPTGVLATATVQVAGRGRGSNVWVSPAGSLMFSFVVRHENELMAKAPMIFLQYIAAMAVVEGVNDYGDGCVNIPLRLKWPNDIYALDPKKPEEKSYVKIGGVLVNSHYSTSEYISVIGIGVNTNNALPTTSLSALLPPDLPRFTSEQLLARIVTTFSNFYAHFRVHGFDARLQEIYYRVWLHSGQVVTLETQKNARARITGLTTDWGFLKAEEIGPDGRSTGTVVQLQPDSNSFDFFKGLVKRKL